MSDQSNGLGLSISGLLGAAALLGVALFQDTPLQTARPAPDGGRLDSSATAEQVPARLWQDPFAAVLRHERSLPQATPSPAGPWRPARNLCQTRTIGGNPVEQTLPHAASAPPCMADQIAERYPARPVQGCPQPLPREPRLLAVMLPGGASAELGEIRIRRRYAVLSALHLAGWVPDNASRIGYFRTLPEAARPNRPSLPDLVPYEWMVPVDGSTDERPLLVLWLEDSAFRNRFHAGLTELLAGILPAGQLADAAALRLPVLGPSSSGGLVWLLHEARDVRAAEQAGTPPPAPADATAAAAMALISGMSGMSGMSETADPSCPEAMPAQPGMALKLQLHVYSATATTADAELFKRAGIDADVATVADYLHDPLNLTLHRTIADDRALADALAAELDARNDGDSGPLLGLVIALRKATSGLRKALFDGWGNDSEEGRGKRPQTEGDPPEQCVKRHWRSKHIVLVSEWDTAYGRSLPASVDQALKTRAAEHLAEGPDCPAPTPADMARRAPTVHRFTYLRGLDGSLAAGSAAAATPAEAAQGTPQLDYLRRLAGRLIDLERALPPRESIGAVGILGSDIYDKLLILQALRPAFPTAIFFTTDLDARLYAPDRLAYTRGLVVASGFGLSLGTATGANAATIDCQGEIPPFRSGYQTGFFYAARYALSALPARAPDACVPLAGPDADPAGIEPASTARVSLFEIGRDGPVALPPLGADAGRSPAAQNRLDAWINLLLLLGIGALLFHLFYHRPVPRWARALGRRLRRRPLGSILMLLLALALIGVLLSFLWPDLERLACPIAMDPSACVEPFSLSSGVSLWGLIYLQLLAVVLSLVFIIQVMLRFRGNLLGLSRRYFLHRGCGPAPEPPPPSPGAALRAELGTWRAGLRHLARALRRGGDQSAAAETDPASATPPTATSPASSDAVGLWRDYCRRSRPGPRVFRVAVLSLVLFALVSALYMATGGGGNSPVRDGDLARIYLELRLLSVFVGGMLAFAVLDITLACRRFIDRLSKASVADEPLRWPDQVADGFHTQLHIDRQRLSPWLALSVISKHADLIMRLVIYPMIVLVVLVIARLPWLDTINLPPSILIAYLLFAFYIFFVAVGIQRAANAAKARTREHYQTLLDGARNAADPDPSEITQLECLNRQVADLHDGAFKPLPARPLVRMALLPFGALGMGLLELFG